MGILSKKLRSFTGSFFASAKPVAALLARAKVLPNTVAGIISQKTKTRPSRDIGFFDNPFRFNVIPFFFGPSRFMRRDSVERYAKTKPA